MKTFTDILKEMDPEATLILADIDMLRIMWDLAEEECERLVKIEQDAKELLDNVQKVGLKPGVFVITFKVDGKYVESLGKSLYGKYYPRVKELKE